MKGWGQWRSSQMRFNMGVPPVPIVLLLHPLSIFLQYCEKPSSDCYLYGCVNRYDQCISMPWLAMQRDVGCHAAPKLGDPMIWLCAVLLWGSIPLPLYQPEVADTAAPLSQQIHLWQVISGPRPDIPVATFNGCLGSILLTNFLYMLSQSLFMQRQGIYRRAECHHWNLWRATKGRWYQCMELRDHDAQVVSQNKCGTSNQ